ncbi:MAG TPA: Mov34/MPN/PAD-1 family protein [Thermoanaerobaculia bacterium]|nr:Mov34/MPN/PAD-1 family protein [Thermoanaerobaculia bacterium]
MTPSPQENRLTFARSRGGRFQIGPATMQTIRRYIQDSPRKLEAGGVLLGRHIADSDDIIVDDLTVPIRGDRRGRYLFMRGHEAHQKVIDRAWRDSEGTCVYLGEWHTHPEPVPTPSSVDCINWKRKLKQDEFNGCVFFAILGTQEVRVWEGHQGGAKLLPLYLK